MPIKIVLLKSDRAENNAVFMVGQVTIQHLLD